MSSKLKHPEWYFGSDDVANKLVNLWHRQAFGAQATAIDIDLMGVCYRCGEPLYLIEATRQRLKGTRYLAQLARRARVPALLVRHNETEILAASFIVSATGPRVIGGEEELKDALQELRLRHECA